MATTTISTIVETVTAERTSTSVVVHTLSITIPLTTVFTPSSSCLAPNFTISPIGYDTFEDGDIIRGLDPRCYPDGFVATTAVTAPSTAPEPTETTATTLTPLPSGPAQTTTSAASSSSASIITSIVLPGTTAVASVSSTATTTEINLSTSTITQFVFSGAPCPASYTTAESTNTVYASQLFNLLTCCPSQMSLVVQSGSPLRCVGQSTSVTIAEAGSIEETSTATTTIMESYRVRAPAIVALSPTSAPPSSNSSTNTLSSSQSQDGLSTGAKAGIGVGVGIGGLILIVGITLLALFRRRRRKSRGDAENETEASTFDKAELPGEGKAIPELSAQIQILEADPKEKPQEMDSSNDKPHEKPQELDSMVVRAELEGDPVEQRSS